VTFTVPDEKIPAGKEVKILCPKCRTQVERKEDDKAQPLEAPTGSESASLHSDFQEPEYEQDSTAELEVVEEGMSVALVCISDAVRLEKIRQILDQLNYFVSTALNPGNAIAKLQRNHYDLVVLDELYSVAAKSENRLLKHIQFLPMHVRRQFFLCLLSQNLPTLNPMSEFQMGVDLILNVQDLDKATVILVRALKDHKNFYRVYAEELDRKGQF